MKRYGTLTASPRFFVSTAFFCLKLTLGLFLSLGVGLNVESSLGADGSETEKSPQLIDLGQMAVDGELRIPILIRFDSEKPIKDLIPIYLKPEFDAFESKLLEPASIKDGDSHVKN